MTQAVTKYVSRSLNPASTPIFLSYPHMAVRSRCPGNFPDSNTRMFDLCFVPGTVLKCHIYFNAV